MTERAPYLRHEEWHADDPGLVVAFAHRGGTDAAPENTIAAFEHAWELGYRYLETDVHLTRDGELVAFHDVDLTRTADIDARIGEMTAAEVAQVTIEHDGATHGIPTMIELFERFPDAHFNIDAKADDSVEPLCDLIDRLGAVDRVCVASFSQRRVDRMRARLRGRVATNLGVAGIAQLRLLGRTRDRGIQLAQVPLRQGRVPIADARFVAASQRAGIPVHVWTVNDRPRMEHLLDLGVDGIMTDETELLRAVLHERGRWPVNG